jgi:hypothetical protein
LNDPFVKALKHLDRINEFETGQQQAFMKGLQQIFFKYDHAILKNRIIPLLMDLTKFNHLISFVLEFIVMIIKNE